MEQNDDEFTKTMASPKTESDISASLALLNKLWFLVIGLAISFMLFYSLEFYVPLVSGNSFDLCRIGSGWGCRESMGHPWSKFLWLPVSLWAVASYSLLLSLNPGRWQQRSCRRLAGFVVAGQCAATVFFLYLIERDFTELCPLCIAGHTGNLLLLIIFVAGRRLVDRQSFAAPPPHVKNKFFRLPIAILLAGYLLQGWTAGVAGRKSIQDSILQSSLLKSVLIGDFDRYHPEADFQHIKGRKDAPHRLTMIGSLACNHCRQMLRQINELPASIVDNVSIWFVPYPLSAACNPRVTKRAGLDRAGCELARKTLENQEQGNFWQWFQGVESRPGRMIRGLASQSDKPFFPQQLLDQISAVNETGISSIPLFFWDGQKLPEIFNTVQMADLLLNLIETVGKTDREISDIEDCGC